MSLYLSQHLNVFNQQDLRVGLVGEKHMQAVNFPI